MKEEDHGSEEAQLTQADERQKDQPQEPETLPEVIGVKLRRQLDDSGALFGHRFITFRGLPGKKVSNHGSGFHVVFGNRVCIPVKRNLCVCMP